MKIIAFDIETGQDKDAEIFMPVFEEPKTKNAKTADEKKTEWLDKTALTPLTGEILAIGFYEKDFNIFRLSGEEGEKNLIKQFWIEYEKGKKNDYFFAGHNIKKFDLPYIIRRGWKYGIKAPIDLIRDRYNLPFFVDTMDIWGQGIYQEFISLDNLAKYLGVGQKNGHGADFAKLFKNEETKEQAIEYLKNDLLLTYKVAQLII